VVWSGEVVRIDVEHKHGHGMGRAVWGTIGIDIDFGGTAMKSEFL